MSTIERAMQKLRGGKPVDADPIPVPMPEALQSVTADASAEVPAVDVAASETFATPEVSAPGPIAVPDEATVQLRSTVVETNALMARADFERLHARGFLMPTDCPDRKSEEYQHIKRRILGNMVSGVIETRAPSNLVMITSSLPGEGKTFTSLNLAVSIAMEMDRTVLLVDTDIIKSDITRLFGIQGRPGLFDVLSRMDLDVGSVLVRTNIPKLVLLPAGTIQEKITEKLASEAMHRLAVELANRYHDRVIIFDCPPVLATTGAVALARFVGQTVLVVEAGKTTQETLKHALEALEHVNVTGLVLNKSKQSPSTSKYYGYGYYRKNK